MNLHQQREALADLDILADFNLENSMFQPGDRVSKVGGDYRFDGIVVAAFLKTSKQRRYVVEDDRGILHIYSDKNLTHADDLQPVKELRDAGGL